MAARQAVLGIDRGSFHYGVTPIFENVSFLLDDARTALVGENGAGKSTLLKCLTGELELAPDRSCVRAACGSAMCRRKCPSRSMPCRCARCWSAPCPTQAGHDDWKIDVLIDDLRIPLELVEQTFGELSGGWQRLMLIAAAKLGEPDIVVLDEPTNHLDIENINKLERWLERGHSPADADRQPRPRVSRSHDEPHDLPAPRRRACLQGAVRCRARGTAAPRRRQRRAPRAGRQGDRPAREGRRALQGLGRAELEVPQATARNRETHRAHRRRTRRGLCRRASASSNSTTMPSMPRWRCACTI